jgi:hypothetical protein
MDINRNNYEAFLLDLLEGRLSFKEGQALNEFLKNHPEHVVDLPDVDLFRLEINHVSFPGKDQLRKEIPGSDSHMSVANFDLFSIARMEGDLSPQQEEGHRSMVSQDKSRLEEWSTWQKTRLVPEQIKFPGKMNLKRKKTVKSRILWLSILSTAATLTLLLILLRSDPVSSGPELSVYSPEESSPAQEPPIVMQEAPVAIVEETPEAAVTEAPQAMPEEASAELNITEPRKEQESLASLTESSPQIAIEEPEPRPLRIAEQLSGNSELIANGSSDLIEPIQTPPVSSNLASLSVSQIAELDRKDLFDEFTEEHNISLMTVANAGIKGINKLTGSDISLLASKDEEGEVTGFRLKSKRFSVTRPLGREE